MVIRYRTSNGDTLDLICYQHYGCEGAITDVLNANQNIAEHGPILPSGIEIILPVVSAKVEETVSLWD